MSGVASLEPSRERTLASRTPHDLQLRRLQRPSSEEVFLTGVARPGAGPQEASRLYAQLAAAMASLGVEPLQETSYGRLDAREHILAARTAAFRAAGLDPTLPCVTLEGTPPGGGALAGVQVWGIVPGAAGTVQVTTEGSAGSSLARCWTGPDYRVLFLPAGQRSQAEGSVTRQARGMLAGAQAALEEHGFSWRSVPRTWIYVARILDWYGELNRVRTGFFAEHGVGDGPGRAFPASTGIQARAGAEECTMALLAVDGPGARVTPLHRSCRQSPAFDYGSAFSRAMSLEIEGEETIFVSGTASIDSAGTTLHVGDVEGQVLETLLSIAALLETRGAGLADICQATLFCKTPEVLQAYHQATRLLQIPALPVVPVLADVCRHELLVEIEAVARVPAGRTS